MTDATDPTVPAGPAPGPTPPRPRRFGPSARRWLLAIAAVPLFLLLAAALFWQACRDFSASAAAGPSLPEVTKGEVIVVLTGDAFRIPRALELLRSRRSDYILFSGVEPGVSLTDIVNQQGGAVTHIHTVWEKILTESRSRTTLENARVAHAILTEKRAKRAVLVTSDYHMPRAARVFRRELSDVELVLYPVPSDFASGTLAGYRKFVVEYGKWLLYQIGILRWLQEWQLRRAVQS